MIKNWYITGDTHGQVNSRVQNLDDNPSETAVIILGDAGINFYLNKTDKKNKQSLQESGFTVYCIRGNHEERPENISTMVIEYDVEVQGHIYLEPDYPNIKYFMDGHAYLINNHPILVIGGAYSVDKWHRLSRFPKDAKWTGWFKDEQLTPEEMNDIEDKMKNHHFDFILSHTCPYSWQPFDLFIGGIDQSTVDNSMEKWLDIFKDKVTWNTWLFGHFHDDRLVRPGVEMYYHNLENMEDIYKRWTSGKEINWWLKKDPNYNIDKEES